MHVVFNLLIVWVQLMGVWWAEIYATTTQNPAYQCADWLMSNFMVNIQSEHPLKYCNFSGSNQIFF